MTINYGKTCFILFHANGKRVPKNFTSLDIDGIIINRVKSAKYIRVIFDEKLSWNEQISYMCKSLLKYFGIFYHIRGVIPKQLARQLYYAFIYSRIKYGIEVYGNCAQTSLHKIQILQNKLLKMIHSLNPRTGTNELHSMLKILKVKDLQSTNIICFVNNCLSRRYSKLFHRYYLDRITPYLTRNRGLLIPKHRTTIGSLSLKIKGAKMWNNFPAETKELRDQLNFRGHVVDLYVNNYRN